MTAISVALTATALFGFSMSHSFWMLCLWAIPYGLGAGGVDASLNNYVALHYSSRHMSWLHCMWGVGASLGPYVLTYALNGGNRWNMGYNYIAFIQVALTAMLLFSLPHWEKKRAPLSQGEKQGAGIEWEGSFFAADHQNSWSEGDHDHILLLLCVRADGSTLGK